MHRSSLRSLVLACTLLGCSGSPSGPEVRPAPELRATPVRVTLGGQELVLETYLWRDFQPISPPDGKPLIGVLRIKAANGSAVPATTRATAAWVVLGSDVWATAVAEEQPRGTTGDAYEVVIRDGPKWGPGVTADVVVRLRDAGGNTVLLRAADQSIHRTD